MPLLRMDGLAQLPIFLSLQGKRAVVAGDSAAAAWKVELLSAAGARVDVYSPHPCHELIRVCAELRHRSVDLHRRVWTTADCADATIMIGALDEEEQATHFAAFGRAARAWVNIVDHPAHSDFTMGAIVNRSPLVIGISTGGAAPTFAQRIRVRLEALIPEGFSDWAQVAQDWRRRLCSIKLTAVAKRRFWFHFSDRAEAQTELVPSDSIFDELLDLAMREGSRPRGSIIYVGVRVDDPQGVTLRELRALQKADVVVCDDAVPHEVLQFARREAPIIAVQAGSRRPRLNERARLLAIGLARDGHCVLRLVSGRKGLAAYCAQEAVACRAAGIVVTTVSASECTPPRRSSHLARVRMAGGLVLVSAVAMAVGEARGADAELGRYLAGECVTCHGVPGNTSTSRNILSMPAPDLVAALTACLSP